MSDESDTCSAVRVTSPVKISLPQSAFKGRMRTYRVTVDKTATTTYDFLEQVRQQVTTLMVDVLKELCSYKFYFEIRYILDKYDDKLKSFQTNPVYLVQESSIQEEYDDVSRNFRNYISRFDATRPVTVVYMDVSFAKCTRGI